MSSFIPHNRTAVTDGKSFTREWYEYLRRIDATIFTPTSQPVYPPYLPPIAGGGSCEELVVQDATTARTLSNSDVCTVIEFTSASAVTVNLPTDATGQFEDGAIVHLVQGGAGQLTVVPAVGVTVEYSDSLKSRTQESTIGLKRVSANKWQLFGDTEPVAPARSALIRSANSAGVPAFVAPTADGQVLKRSSGTLVFGALTAAEVTSTATGSVSATNVQAAIAELEAEKQPLDTQLTTIAGLTMTGNAGKALLVNSGGTDFELGTVATDLTNISTDVKLNTVGKGLHITEGTNAMMGVATLVAGSSVVSTTKITANSRVFISIQSLGTVSVPKAIGVTARTAGTSFTLTSEDATDTSVIAWMIVEPYTASNDPNFANVSSLLHFDGADGSTTFTDVTGKTWTANGNAQIDTAQSKWGGASGLFDGTGDFINTASSADFAYGTSDFTWEFWLRLNSTAGNQYIIDHGSNGGTIQYNGKLTYYNSTTGIGSALYTTGGGTLSTGTWYHVAISRQSGTTRFYVDGVQISSASDTHNYAAQALNVGRYGAGGNNYNGWLDDFRITKGVARYTTAFSPPAAAFPDA